MGDNFELPEYWYTQHPHTSKSLSCMQAVLANCFYHFRLRRECLVIVYYWCLYMKLRDVWQHVPPIVVELVASLPIVIVVMAFGIIGPIWS